jgi:hypothetical protein
MLKITNLRALTWHQPFASAMLHDKIETRRRKTNVRGQVLICASQKEYTDEQLDNISGHHQTMRIIQTLSPLKIETTLGQAIAIGNLVDCRPMQPDDEDACFVKYHPDLWCWIFKDVRPIKHMPWKGSQGWRIVPQEIINKIEFM